VTWTVLLPAFAVIGALGTLTVGMRSVERELVALRLSLRRTGATAIAADELGRASTELRINAVALQADAHHRLRRRHSPRRLRSRRSDR